MSVAAQVPCSASWPDAWAPTGWPASIPPSHSSRLPAAAVPGAEVRLAAAEALPFEDDAFDIVMSQLVVNFMADAHQGVSEMRRVGSAAPWRPASGTTPMA